MEMKTCCATGHRDLPAEKLAHVKERLTREILLAIEDGFTVFISGFAEGIDLLFAQCVVEQRQKHPHIFLEAAIPYAGRVKSLGEEGQALLGKCNGVRATSDAFWPGCFMLRNRYMVLQSQRVIAVYDGRGSGGTAATMRYANCLERDIRVIDI